MKAFLIALPVFDNAGRSYDKAHAAFQKCALETAGGYTRRPHGEGAWRDPADGRVYVDSMVPYVVACTRPRFNLLKREAFRLFPDQVALYWQELGEVHIERRKA